MQLNNTKEIVAEIEAELVLWILVLNNAEKTCVGKMIKKKWLLMYSTFQRKQNKKKQQL